MKTCLRLVKIPPKLCRISHKNNKSTLVSLRTARHYTVLMLCVTKSVRGEIDFFFRLSLSPLSSPPPHSHTLTHTTAAENILSLWSTQGQSNHERVALVKRMMFTKQQSGELVELKLPLCKVERWYRSCLMYGFNSYRGGGRKQRSAAARPSFLPTFLPSFFFH